MQSEIASHENTSHNVQLVCVCHVSDVRISEWEENKLCETPTRDKISSQY